MPEPLSPYAQRFVAALQALCREHEMTLAVSGFDTLQIWDLEEVAPYGPLHCAGIEDRLGREWSRG